MKEGQVALAAQILTTMKDAAKKLEEALKKNNIDDVTAIKKELLDLQRQLGELI